jgi:glycosyltransferase involved in cell wall biosynthesis
MRIVHLTTSDISGGAARAASRLHNGLKRLGVSSQVVCAKKAGFDPDTKLFKPDMRPMSRLRRKLRRSRIRRDFARYNPTRPPGYELFSDDRSEDGGALLGQIPPCDLINLHWISKFLDHESFFRGAPQVPLVWRLADMAPLTGGCHYDDGCGRFTSKCGACPQLGSADENDLSRQIWLRKHEALAALPKGRLNLVATSNWIAGEARRSSLLRDLPITVIPNGLDTADFAPRDKGFARQTLDVPVDARVVLFAAETLSVRRKGFALLLEALSGLRGDVRDLVLLSVGHGQPVIDAPIRHIHLGSVNVDRYLSLAYSAADVFVIPSVQESFGQTVSESLACGTPVVGFATGGMLDMVRPGTTGQLVPVGDTAGLRDAILNLLGQPDLLRRMSQNCRAIAVNEYSMDVQAKAYARLYESLITPPPRNSAAGHGPAKTECALPASR